MTQEHAKSSRPVAGELEQLLGLQLKVLDDGFVRVVDYMGSDESIVQAARVSYGTGTKRLHEDRGLIRYLMRHRHTTPFEMCEIKLHVRVPMDCWRQWIRHRMASVNEYSTRYSEAIDAAQSTLAGEWRSQTSLNRQGSGSVLDESIGSGLTEQEERFHKAARELYEERLEKGVAREQARKDLPLSTYTEAYWKIDLHNLFHFLALRMDSHAQLEIRSYATIIGNDIVSKWCPIAWEAFKDYRLNATGLTRLESEVLSIIIRGDATGAVRFVTEAGLLVRSDKGIERNREREELETKLERLGIDVPWGK